MTNDQGPKTEYCLLSIVYCLLTTHYSPLMLRLAKHILVLQLSNRYSLLTTASP